MIKAAAYIDTKGGLRKQRFEVKPPDAGFLDADYRFGVKLKIEEAVSDLVYLYGTRITSIPYIEIESHSPVWDMSVDEIDEI